METPESGEEGASCFANLLWCPIETQHPCLDVWMSPGAAENAKGKKLVQAMKSRRKSEFYVNKVRKTLEIIV